MGFLNFVEKLQKKPEASKRKIVFLSALAITGLIFVFWFVSSNSPLRQDRNQKNIKGPFESIKEEFSNFYQLFKGKL